MRTWRFGCALTFAFAVGCGSSEPPAKANGSGNSAASVGSAAKTNVVEKTDSEGKPQPKLRTIKLWMGPEEMVAEIAMSNNEIMTGMMFRTQMAENEGMLFVFNGPQQISFWMKNTLLPLSCAYIDPDGTILEEHDMKPKDETTIPSASDRVQYVLEVKQGWFERHNIKVGTQVRTERGTLAETFFRRR